MLAFADSEDGVVLAANGIDKMLRWDGYDSAFSDAGVEPPTATPALAGSGTGALAGTYRAIMRFVDRHGNYSNPSPFSDQAVVALAAQIDYTNLEVPSSSEVVRRQILRNTSGQSSVYYVDIDTTDIGSPSLSSTRTDFDLAGQEAQSLFAADGTSLYDRFTVPPNTLSVLAPHLGRMWGCGTTDYAEGSVAVTLNSTTVTGTMIEWKETFVGRFIHVGGADKPYEIASVDTAEGTLELTTPYLGDTDPYAAYSIRPDPTLIQQVSYSEAGRPEAWPADNALTLKEDGDRPMAVVLSGSFLYIAKRRSMTKITAQSDPALDAYLYDSAKRGCVGHRAWTRVDGIAHVLDEQGVYVFDGRNADPISTRIQDLFRGTNRFGFRINWKCARYFHALHCPLEETVRFFVTMNGGYLPRYALCYGTKADKWWIEQYPYPIGASCLARRGRSTGGWGASTEQAYAAGRAAKVWAIDGPLDGRPSWQPDYSNACVSAGPVTILPPRSLDDGIVGAPISVVSGRGRDQTRVIVAVRADGTIVVDRPWSVRPAAGDLFAIGTVSYKLRTHRMEYAEAEAEEEFTVDLGFEPAAWGDVQVRLYSDHADEPDKLVKRHAPDQKDGVSGVEGDLGPTVSLAGDAGRAILRANRHLEPFTDGVTTVAVELAGHSGPSRHTFNKLTLSGVEG